MLNQNVCHLARASTLVTLRVEAKGLLVVALNTILQKNKIIIIKKIYNYNNNLNNNTNINNNNR